MKTKDLLIKIQLKLQPFTKAISAFIALLVPFVTVVAAVFADGQVVGLGEWTMLVSAIGALVGGTGAVYQFPNIPKEGR